MHRILLAVAAAFLIVRPAGAWGTDAHQVIARIAESALSADTRRQIHALLPKDRHSLADIADWADVVRRSRPDTADWHYVNIPVTARRYDRARDCANDDCVVERITLKMRQLSNRSLLAPIRLEALRWLVHLVGDIHQPLHCADNHDRGGNDVKVVFGGRTLPLHRVWDSGIIDAVIEDTNDLVTRLSRPAPDADHDAWQSLRAPADWANESFRLAKTQIYAPLNLLGHPGPTGHPLVLAPDYADRNIAVVETQLRRAGVRLAAVLETSLARSFWQRLRDWF